MSNTRAKNMPAVNKQGQIGQHRVHLQLSIEACLKKLMCTTPWKATHAKDMMYLTKNSRKRADKHRLTAFARHHFETCEVATNGDRQHVCDSCALVAIDERVLMCTLSWLECDWIQRTVR